MLLLTLSHTCSLCCVRASQPHQWVAGGGDCGGEGAETGHPGPQASQESTHQRLKDPCGPNPGHCDGARAAGRLSRGLMAPIVHVEVGVVLRGNHVHVEKTGQNRRIGERLHAFDVDQSQSHRTGIDESWPGGLDKADAAEGPDTVRGNEATRRLVAAQTDSRAQSRNTARLPKHDTHRPYHNQTSQHLWILTPPQASTRSLAHAGEVSDAAVAIYTALYEKLNPCKEIKSNHSPSVPRNDIIRTPTDYSTHVGYACRVAGFFFPNQFHPVSQCTMHKLNEQAPHATNSVSGSDFLTNQFHPVFIPRRLP